MPNELTTPIFKTVHEYAPYTFTFPTTISQLNTFYVSIPTVSSTPLVFGVPLISGTQVQLPISGGTDSTDYIIVFQVTDITGRILERLATVVVRDLENYVGTGPDWRSF
jgi:hypothetical protein